MESTVRRFPVADVDAALRAYYGTGYIGNREIGEIFGVKAGSTISKLKKPVMEEETIRGKAVIVPKHVNVKIAFEIWGINVKELEHNRKKLHELGLSATN